MVCILDLMMDVNEVSVVSDFFFMINGFMCGNVFFVFEFFGNVLIDDVYMVGVMIPWFGRELYLL